MTRTYSHEHVYDSPWVDVALAFFLRYPNPLSPHVISCDVISRSFDPTTLRLHTTRVLLKKGKLPKWAPRSVAERSESWILEESVLDLATQSLECTTSNLDHKNYLSVTERQRIQRADLATQAKAITLATVTSDFGYFGLGSRVEHMGITRFKNTLDKSRAGVSLILKHVQSPFRHQLMTSGPLRPYDFGADAHIRSRLPEGFAAWESVAAGFQGHGYDDAQPERYIPAPTTEAVQPVKPIIDTRWIVETAKYATGRLWGPESIWTQARQHARRMTKEYVWPGQFSLKWRWRVREEAERQRQIAA
ncbi:uncharacterized protein L969DRAFT_67931, partial [Mixia osmundae IAM 14324]